MLLAMHTLDDVTCRALAGCGMLYKKYVHYIPLILNAVIAPPVHVVNAAANRTCLRCNLCRRAPAFKGTGRTLGGEPSAASSSSSAAAAAAASDAGGGEWAGVNESKPTTSLQLRLFDGSRMVARFNTTHTVADVRRFIRAARPDLAAVPFTLATAFPPSTIEDSAQTLEAAGLLNAAIIVKK